MRHSIRAVTDNLSRLTWRKKMVVLALIVAATGLRLWVLGSDGSPNGDSARRYLPLATNILAGNGFTTDVAPPYHPSGFDQPGYPLFLASLFGLTQHSLRAVVLAQLLMELGIVLLMCLIVRALKLGPRTEMAACVFGLVCPFLPVWSGLVMTEVAATFGATLTCYALLQSVVARRRDRFMWWSIAGLAGGAALLTRADMVVSLGLMVVAAAVLGCTMRPKRRRFLTRRRPFRSQWLVWARRTAICRRGLTAYACITVFMLLPWAARNYSTLGLWRPLGQVADQQSNGYVLWLGTWVDNTTYQESYWWRALNSNGPTAFPEDKLPDAGERAAAMAALDLARRRHRFAGEPSRRFFELANQARWNRPWSCCTAPVKRLVSSWWMMAQFTPVCVLDGMGCRLGGEHSERERTVLYYLNRIWRCILLLGIAGLGYALWRRPRGFAILGALLLGRSLLPIVSGIGTEPRYLLEALPICFVFAGLGVEAAFVLAKDALRWRIAARQTAVMHSAGPALEGK